MATLRSKLKKISPWPIHYLYRKIYYFPKDFSEACKFIFHKTKTPTTFWQRKMLVWKFYRISYLVDCPHTEHEMIHIARAMLDLGDIPGALVECGAFHGGSTAKFSLVAKLAKREFHVFDSFEGMPENKEAGGESIYGREHHFPKGSHAVRIDEVRENVEKYGDISRTKFHKGFFSETLPDFKEPVALACMNVDLALSTKDCLKYLSPLMSKDGIIYSQDAHFPWIIELLKDDRFWQNEIGILKPKMDDLGKLKFVAIHY